MFDSDYWAHEGTVSMPHDCSRDEMLAEFIPKGTVSMSESTRTLGKDDVEGLYLMRGANGHSHLCKWDRVDLVAFPFSDANVLSPTKWTVLLGPLMTKEDFEQTPRVKRWMEIEAENERLSLELKKESMAHSATCKSLKSFLDQCTRQEEELAELRQIRERAAYVDSDFRRCGVKASLPIELRQSIEHLCRLYDPPPFVPPPKPELAARLFRTLAGSRVFWGIKTPKGIFETDGDITYSVACVELDPTTGQPISSKEQSDA